MSGKWGESRMRKLEDVMRENEQLKREIKRLKEGLYAIIAMSLEDGIDIMSDICTDLLLGESLQDCYKQYVPKGKEVIKQYE